MPYVIFFFNVCEKWIREKKVGQELLSFLPVGREDILMESVEPAKFITSELLKLLWNGIKDHTNCEMQCIISI